MMPTPHWMTGQALALSMLPASQAGAQASRPADLLAAYSQEAGRPRMGRWRRAPTRPRATAAHLSTRVQCLPSGLCPESVARRVMAPCDA